MEYCKQRFQVHYIKNAAETSVFYDVVKFGSYRTSHIISVVACAVEGHPAKHIDGPKSLQGP